MAEVETGTVTQQALDSLDNFAERNRRADEQAELIQGMPALLERGVIYVVAAALLITVAILYFGKVDAVVETKGKILPRGNVMTIQATNGGVVLKVHAHAGDRLSAGAPIVDVDTSEAGINLAQLKRKLALDQNQLDLLRSTLQRLDRILADPRIALRERQSGAAIAGNAYQLLNALENAEIRLDAGAQDERLAPERKQALQQEYEVTRQRIAMLQRSRGDTQRTVAAEEAALARKKEQLQNVRKLAENKLLSVVELNSEEERYLGAQTSLANQQQRLDQIDIDTSTAQLRLSELRTKLQSFDNESNSNARSARAQYDQALANLRQERENLQIQSHGLESDIDNAKLHINVSEHRLALAAIVMPVAGTISDLRVRNAGEIVAAGAAVATVVPAGVPLMVEASAADKDVGFVRPGVEARVKVDAFPFQQFGTVPARVTRVLPAVGENASFIVQLDLLDKKLTMDGSDFYLFPGLSVHADLITHKQRLIDVLLQNKKEGGDKKEGGRE